MEPAPTEENTEAEKVTRFAKAGIAIGSILVIALGYLLSPIFLALSYKLELFRMDNPRVESTVEIVYAPLIWLSERWGLYEKYIDWCGDVMGL